MEKSNVILYIAMSLDGYIARPDGAVDWLDDVEGDGDKMARLTGSMMWKAMATMVTVNSIARLGR